MGNNIKKLRKDEITKYYEIGGKLGTGSFAVVKQATRKSDGKQFAIKIIKKSKLNPDELAVVHDEVEIMHKVDHPNCVKLYEMFETSKKLYMVLELLTGGELLTALSPRAPTQKRKPRCSFATSLALSSTCTASVSSTEISSPRTCCT